MPKRDSNGRFIKEEGEGWKFTLILPSFSSIIFWALSLLILSPWIMMLIKLKIWKEILAKFEELFFIKEGVSETNKKNGLFG